MDTKENTQSVHWADITADKIIRERKQFLNDKKTKYVCASGITPSGTVHIGNFREIMRTRFRRTSNPKQAERR